ncbi:hypothetical protein [Delftia sp. PS-11]|uniref:hypothetical protein n=1 Tax=Delftia sp. PS-11 TaxID=2767222 RepID=UPI002457A899|nr:hypothetical protein [Delftia sp. PS-11]KAJ8741809.1 hypothetical protein H9T68_20825 [Delftia sp. PS-11]
MPDQACEPQPGDIYAYREDGAVLFIPPARQLTQWRGTNPFQERCRQPLGESPEALRKILGAKKRQA